MIFSSEQLDQLFSCLHCGWCFQGLTGSCSFLLGVDTRVEWEMHIIKVEKSYSYIDGKYSLDKLRKEAQMSCGKRHVQDNFKIISRTVDLSHQRFISLHCEKLLDNLFLMKKLGERNVFACQLTQLFAFI